ncbi:YaiI/YqxD family protein [Caldalkalibacillus salinus]|uniref:YaiI/YqxD family protein n=1 Tax=Caldalkalibacillus salinus TaxID=2803787 RepID=UPI001924CD5C|nr:YaiI/YqxD family protein [Caldalkalibacillus salinus]
MHIYVDADACPVKDEIIDEAKKANIPVTLVRSFAHYSPTNPEGVHTIYVDTGADAADYRIMKEARQGDLIITQDYGLAALALARGCCALHHLGFQYTEENISSLLDTRYSQAKARKSGQKTKGPKPFTKADRERFRSALRALL